MNHKLMKPFKFDEKINIESLVYIDNQYQYMNIDNVKASIMILNNEYIFYILNTLRMYKVMIHWNDLIFKSKNIIYFKDYICVISKGYKK